MIAPPCPPLPALVAPGLPAPVLVARAGAGACAALARPDGRVSPARARARPGFRGTSFPLTAPELTVLSRAGRILVARSGTRRIIWRSGNRYPQPGTVVLVTGIAASTERIAFSVDPTVRGGSRSRLYVADLSGAERRAHGAVGEGPVGWTAAGQLITQRRGRVLVLRGPDGARLRTLATGVGAFDWDPRSRTVVAVRARALWRLGSGPDRRLVRMAALGLPGPVWIQVLARGRIAVVGPRAIAITRAGGDPWARASFPGGAAIADQGSLETSPDGRGVAFLNVRHRAGSASVALLTAGDRRAERLLELRFGAQPTPFWSARLAWRGRWLLVAGSQGRVVALRPGGPRVDLSRIGRALAADGRSVVARWDDR